MAKTTRVRARTTFHGPAGLVVVEGDEFDDNAAPVRSWPSMFEPVDGPVERPVETAARRSVSDGARKSAK